MLLSPISTTPSNVGRIPTDKTMQEGVTNIFTLTIFIAMASWNCCLFQLKTMTTFCFGKFRGVVGRVETVSLIVANSDCIASSAAHILPDFG